MRIARLAAEAMSAERRIRKEINIEAERARYTLLCQRLEAQVLGSCLMKIMPLEGLHLFRSASHATPASPTSNSWLAQFSAILSEGKLPTVAIDETYLDFLRLLSDDIHPGRVGASFFPVSEVATHIDVFNRLCQARDLRDVPALHTRMQFFQWALQSYCGVIEIQYQFAPLNKSGSDTLPYRKRIREQLLGTIQARAEAAGGVISLAENELHEIALLESEYKRRQVGNLSLAVLQAINHGGPANFSNRPNDIIAEVLHRIVYVPPLQDIQPTRVRIVYADGSEARPIVFRCLPEPLPARISAAERSSFLRASLMSMRHLDLDQSIDLVWFRNREVSKSRTLAETDEYCYQTTLTLLQTGSRDGPVFLHLYHTGFEPAVLGFYRGIVEALIKGQRVGVLPYYYRDRGQYELGSWWL